jgi:electron transfer flavoprotein alpha/beta subunit
MVLELVGTPGLQPLAINEAVSRGTTHPLRVVDEALGSTDAHATGLVVERVLHDLAPALVLFCPAADPEGLADVPAALAFRQAVPCIPGVFDVTNDGSETQPRFVARARRGLRTVLLEVPRGAILGVDSPASDEPGHAAVSESPAEAPGASETTIRVITLPDLGVERAQVRRRNDLRGVIESAARPLVTTRSVESLVSLLR